jgi:hypothetical protein
MRKLLLLASFFLGMAIVVPAAQRAAVVPAVPTAAVHAMPVAPVSVSHAVQPHVAPQVHSEAHAAASTIRPVVPRKPVPHPVPPQLPPSISGNPGRPGRFPPGTGVALAFIGGGYYIPGANDVDSAPEDDAQGSDSNQQIDSGQEGNEQGPTAQESNRSDSNSDSGDQPPAEFVFVQRDGGTLFAVAYTTWNGKIQYVTKEGLRRTVALDSLDLEATQKFNEERGNTINLPTPPNHA